MATDAAAISSGYFGSVQGLPTHLAPAASRRNRLLLRCSVSGGDGAGGPDPVLEEQKRCRAKLSAGASLFRWLAKLGPPGALAGGLLKAAGVGAARRGPELPQVAGTLAAGDTIFLPLYIIHLQGRRPQHMAHARARLPGEGPSIDVAPQRRQPDRPTPAPPTAATRDWAAGY